MIHSRKWFLAGWILGLSLLAVTAQNIRREYWLNIPGSSLGDLKGSSDYPNGWSGVDFPALFEGPINWNDDYGTRFRGYVEPPVTGQYVFWISGDDQSELYLSSNEYPVSKQLIASVASWTSSREWDKEPGQQSAPVQLEAGRFYYIEALHKEGQGGDNIAVGWRLPDGTLERPIPGNRVSPFLLSTNPPVLIQPPIDVTVAEGEMATFRVLVTGAEPLVFQWQRDGQNVAGAVFPDLILGPVRLDDDGAMLRCRVTNPLGELWTDEVILRVGPEQVPPGLLAITPPPNATVRQLTMIEVLFDEPVQGVDASDLLVNEQVASNVTGIGAGPYLFTFDAPASGIVDVSWASGHGITDLALVPNPFPGGTWTVTLDPAFTWPDVVLNEFMASNLSGLTDEDGQAEDWIELHNRGSAPAALNGWALTDDSRVPDQWRFPDVTLPPGGFLVVFASAKDRRDAGSLLHTNFRLSRTGEFLGLYRNGLPREQADALTPVYPEQRGDHSYGRNSAGDWLYFASPTPGAPNGSSTIVGVVEPPHFSAQRGFYATAFDLHLSAEEGAAIRYTTNGREPTALSTSYSGPIRIGGSTILRAATFKPNHLPSVPVTHTYLVGVSTGIRSLPVLSLVTAHENLWGATGIMETNPRNTIYRGRDWERPVSVEFIRPWDHNGFQIDAGLRLQGGDYVRQRYDPNASLPFSKYSFRLYFRGDYGARQLEYPLFPDIPVRTFDQIVLRAGMNDHSNPFIIDELIRRLFAATGQVSSHGTFVNLFLNGQYKGYYNPTERIGDDFLRSWHGGDDEWDLIAQYGEVLSGDANKWNELLNFTASADMSDPAAYANVATMLDVDNFIDYLLVNIYGATGDWPHNNWRVARPRRPDGRFQFITWDAEWAFGLYGRSVSHNVLAEELAGGSEIARLFRSLRVNSEFRMRFADRLHRHFFNDGPLTDAAIAAQYWALRQELSGVLPNMDSMIHQTWIPQRRNIIFNQLREAGLYASDHAPSFNPGGGPVASDSVLTMTASRGTIYYTSEGSDPRVPPTTTGQERIWVSAMASKRVLVPTATNGGMDLGGAWRGGVEPFNDGAWIHGDGGVGYDTDATYLPHFQIDLREAMHNKQSSAFIRIPFSVTAEDLSLIDEMLFRVQYDDGFVAWLNGSLLASANAPAFVSWDSVATQQNPDSAAVNFQPFNVTARRGLLRAGSNVLAIQGLNAGASSSDFLINVELVGRTAVPAQIHPSAHPYDGPVVLPNSVTVRARTLDGAEWSALTEATFVMDEPGLPLRITEIMYNPPGGDAYEFLELHNAGFAPIDLSGYSFQGIQLIFPAGSVLPGGGLWVLAAGSNPTAFAARYPGVPVAARYGGNLSNGGERIALLDPSGNVVLAVEYNDADGWPTEPDGGGASLELADANGDPNAPDSWRASATIGGTPGHLPDNTPLPVVRLNEIMAHNVTAVPHGGAYPDWVELFNAGAVPVSLSGWSLTDSGDPRQFVFPPGTSIAAGAHLIVWCDSDVSAPGLHTGFALNRAGESVFLYDDAGRRIDAVSFGRQLTDLSLGRIASGDHTWQLTTPTPGQANVAATVAPASSLTINEWLAHPALGEPTWLELHNTHSSLPVSLQGIFLGNGNVAHRLAARSFLEPGGFAQIFADPGAGVDRVEFTLSSLGGTIELLNSSGQLLETVNYGGQNAEISEGRLPDGADTVVTFPGSASPGASNFVLEWTGPVLNEFLALNNGVVTMDSGRAADWLEIRNPGPTPFDLSGMSLSIGRVMAGEWSFPNGTVLGAGGHLVVWCDNRQPASTGLTSELNTGRALSGTGDSIYLFDGDGRLIDSVQYGFQIADQSVGRSGNDWQLMASPTPGSANSGQANLGSPFELRINEWLANPVRGDDFIELFNRAALPVALTGLYLTDDPSLAGRTRFQIGALSFIAPHGWVAYRADGGSNPGSVNFGLSASGEHVRLYAADLSLIDFVDFGAQLPGVSSGRFPDGATTMVSFATTVSPGDSNHLPLGNVVINEVLAHSDPPLEDAIELHNVSGTTVDIGGWYLSDDGTNLRKYRIPAGTTIGAGGYRVFYEYQFHGGTGSIVPFSLNSARGDTVYLAQVDGADNLTGYRAQVSFGPTFNGVSVGRHLTSQGAEMVAQIRPTFGVEAPASLAAFRLGQGATNAGPAVGPLVINEIMAVAPDLGDLDPPDAEFLELKNISETALNLFDPSHPTNTWQLRDGIRFVFPTNTTLASDEHVVIVRFDPITDTVKLNAFRERYSTPASTRLFGPFEGRLASEGENIEIVRPDAPQTSGPDIGLVPYVLSERVDYAHLEPWPGTGIGEGASLQRIDSTAFGNEPLNWSTGVPTAGGWNGVDLTDSDDDGMPDFWERNHGLNRLDANDAADDADGDGISNLEEYRAGTDPRDAASYLRIVELGTDPAGVWMLFPAEPGRSYTVQFSDGFDWSDWESLRHVEAAFYRRDIQFTDTVEHNTRRFYRIVTPAQR
jgi:hypothetical protein